MSMLNGPHHLLQPLSVDTNISYDLDMSKFPGMDDPHQMYEPALLIATDWSQYVYSDEYNNGQNISTLTADIDTDWINDLEEAVFPDLISNDVLDPDTFQALIDDVTEDPVISNELDILGINSDSSCISQDIQNVAEYTADSSMFNYITSVDLSHDVSLFPESSNDVFEVQKKGQKRGRACDMELYGTPKKSKNDYTCYPKLPEYVSWQSDSSESVLSCRRS